METKQMIVRMVLLLISTMDKLGCVDSDGDGYSFDLSQMMVLMNIR